MASTPCHRVGDPNTAGAPVVSSQQSFVRNNGALIAVNGSPVAGHGPAPHAAPVTAQGSSVLRIDGIPANRTGDADTCGHARAAGSPNLRYD